MVVAVDGSSGSGKSSTSRGVAERLGLRYLDTGAQYRAVTWWMLLRGVDVTDHDAVAARAIEPRVESGTDPADPTITVDGVDVSEAIRAEDVTGAVSDVAAVGAVRTRLVALQRAIIGDGGIVVEGRDIGSVVWPDAAVKVHLGADVSARAARRAAEQGSGDTDATAADLERRDAKDSGRAVDPARRADGSHDLDTTDITLTQAIDAIVALVEDAHAAS
ncbi:(d)CMP kinase [Nocardioidaceae bacterium]|nr:(d)CMP kinase [Nocardioidaceae bacterium]